jgi:hypothetical protein
VSRDVIETDSVRNIFEEGYFGLNSSLDPAREVEVEDGRSITSGYASPLCSGEAAIPSNLVPPRADNLMKISILPTRLIITQRTCEKSKYGFGSLGLRFIVIAPSFQRLGRF